MLIQNSENGNEWARKNVHTPCVSQNLFTIVWLQTKRNRAFPQKNTTMLISEFWWSENLKIKPFEIDRLFLGNACIKNHPCLWHIFVIKMPQKNGTPT